ATATATAGTPKAWQSGLFPRCDDDRCGRALRRTVIDGLDVVAVGIEHERRVVPGVVMPLAGCTGVAVGRLEGEMHMRQRPLLDFAHEELVGEEIAVAFAGKIAAERLQHGAIEPLAGGEVADDDMHVVEQPAEMYIHDAFLCGSRTP